MDRFVSDHLYAQEENFAKYPEPSTSHAGRLELRETYVDGLEDFIGNLATYINQLQADEGQKLDNFGKALKEINSSADNQEPEDLQEDYKNVTTRYSRGIRNIKKRRKKLRAIMYDALDQRQKFLDSMIQQRAEQEIVRQKLKLINAEHEAQPEAGEKTVFDSISAILLLFQVVLMLVYRMVIIFANTTDVATQNGGPYRADDYYSYLIHISLLVTFGYGYLLVFVRKYFFSATAFNFVLVAIVTQFALLMKILFWNIAFRGSSNWMALEVSIPDIIWALYASAAVAISWAVVSGKLNFFELFGFSLLETFFYALNYYVCIWKIKAVDPGGAMTIHVFGAYFGVAASFWLAKPMDRTSLRLYMSDRTSSYHSNFLTLIGTIFVFCLLPSFNAAFAPDGSQYRVTVNTFVAMVAGATIAFFFSRCIRRSLFHIVDVQYSTLVAGIAMGSGHAAIIKPGGALLVGAVAGWLGVICFSFVRSWMEKKFPFNTFDTRGAAWMHAVPGFIGGVASAIALSRTYGSVYGQPNTALFPRDLPNQGGYQAACLAVSIGIGVGGGFLAGFLLWFIRRIANRPIPPPYLDEFEFHVPSDYPRSHLTGGIPEP